MWLEYDNQPLLGPGRYQLLKSLTKTNSLKISAQNNKLSYKTAFNYIKIIESRIGERIITTTRGGTKGGGTTTLSTKGKELINQYENILKRFEQ